MYLSQIQWIYPQIMRQPYHVSHMFDINDSSGILFAKDVLKSKVRSSESLSNEHVDMGYKMPFLVKGLGNRGNRVKRDYEKSKKKKRKKEIQKT